MNKKLNSKIVIVNCQELKVEAFFQYIRIVMLSIDKILIIIMKLSEYIRKLFHSMILQQSVAYYTIKVLIGRTQMKHIGHKSAPVERFRCFKTNTKVH